MEFFLIAMAGVVGTTTMIGVMALINRFKWANADMVRAIGSIYTRSYELSLVPGLMIHYSFGLFFAFAYAMLVGVSPILTRESVLIISTMTGFVHGLMVGLMLEIMVAEHHPLERFRRVGFPVVASHVIGHVFYGVAVGAFFALTWNRIHDTVENFVQGGIIGDFLGYSFIWLPLFGPPLFFVGYLLYSAMTTEIRFEARKLERKHRSANRAASRGRTVRRIHPKKSRSRAA